MQSYFNIGLEILRWPSSPILNLVLLWKSVRISALTECSRIEPKRKNNTQQSFLPTLQQDCPSAGWSPGLVTALQPCRLTGSPAVLQRAHMLRTCRSHHAEGLRRGFRCSACSQEAENMSDKVQGSEYLTHPASQTRFCLGALEFTLTHSFCTTPYAGMGVDFGCTARLILPMYNPNFTVPSQGQCLERESKHIYNIIKVKACHNRVNE